MPITPHHEPRMRDLRLAHVSPRPRPLGDVTVHYWRVIRMARATGTDLVAATSDGALTQQAWADMVQRCRACPWADGCGRWLDQAAQPPRDTPRTCVNRRHFAMLHQQTPA